MLEKADAQQNSGPRRSSSHRWPSRTRAAENLGRLYASGFALEQTGLFVCSEQPLRWLRKKGGFGRLSYFSLSYALTTRALLPNSSMYQLLTNILILGVLHPLQMRTVELDSGAKRALFGPKQGNEPAGLFVGNSRREVRSRRLGPEARRRTEMTNRRPTRDHPSMRPATALSRSRINVTRGGPALAKAVGCFIRSDSSRRL